jgi:hypothetical protein
MATSTNPAIQKIPDGSGCDHEHGDEQLTDHPPLIISSLAGVTLPLKR